MHHAFNTVLVASGIALNEAGRPVDTTVLEIKMEKNINDQENSNNDAESVENICKILEPILKQIASWPMFIT